MSINQSSLQVTVKAPSAITVGVPDRRVAATTNTQPITLKAQARTSNYIGDLLDVDESLAANGSTLVYDSVNDKYVVKQLTATDINLGNLDGGSF